MFNTTISVKSTCQNKSFNNPLFKLFFYPVFRFANQSEQAEEGAMFVSTVILVERCVDDQ